MRRFTLFSFILLIAISICFFSSAVFAGGGANDDFSDTHPWDMDDIVDDTTNHYISGLDRAPESNGITNPLLWLTYSISNNFTLWFFVDEPMVMNEKRVEENAVAENNIRGIYRTKKLIN